MPGMTAANDIADALRDQAVAGVVDTLHRNDEVLGEFKTRPFTGGSTINVKMHYAGNTSVGTYDEGDAIGEAGHQSYLTAMWPEKHYKLVVEITGHARDYTRNGSNQAVFFDQVGLEFEKGMKDLVHKVSTDALGTGTTAPVGIQGIVDDAGTVAGLSRATYTWFQAYEVAGTSTTVVVNDLTNALSTSQDAPYAANVDEIWTSWKQVGKLRIAMGNAGVANSPIRINVQGAGPVTLNSGSPADPIYFGAVPVRPKRNLTNSIFLGLTKSEFFMGVMRDYTVKELGATGDSDRYLVTCAYGLGCDNPQKSWKVTGYTA